MYIYVSFYINTAIEEPKRGEHKEEFRGYKMGLLRNLKTINIKSLAKVPLT